MRDIVTRVAYGRQSSSSPSSSASSIASSISLSCELAPRHTSPLNGGHPLEESNANFDDDDDDDRGGLPLRNSMPAGRNSANCCSNSSGHNNQVGDHKKSLHSQQRCLDSDAKLLRKLTRTRWQRPRDGSLYCQQPHYNKVATQQQQHRRRRQSSQSAASLSELLIGDYKRAGGCSAQVRPALSVLTEELNDEESEDIDGEDQRNLSPVSQRGEAASKRIVKHKQTNSRKLLRQLARLRGVASVDSSRPNTDSLLLYKVRRPEREQRIEALIDELERATIAWDEDDELLDRAELRDLRANQRFVAMHKRRSHAGHYDDDDDDELLSRYNDDLAVRRYLRSPSPSVYRQSERSPQMSYLLCSDAYTPTSPRPSAYQRQGQRQTPQRGNGDDLLARKLRAKQALDAHEPPFGVPRQLASAASHSSATHYLRRPAAIADAQNENRSQNISRSQREFHGNKQLYGHHQSNKVKFCPSTQQANVGKQLLHSKSLGRVSTDSGLAVDGSPISPTSPIIAMHNVVAVDERRSKFVESPTVKLGELPLIDSSEPQVVGVADDDYDDDDDELGYRESNKLLATNNNNTSHYNNENGNRIEYEDMAEEIYLSDEDYDYDENDLNYDDEYEQDEAYRNLLCRAPSNCSSPNLEYTKAELRATPVKEKSRLDIAHPRAKSLMLPSLHHPLSRARIESNKTNQRLNNKHSYQHHTNTTSQQNKVVEVSTFEESMKRRSIKYTRTKIGQDSVTNINKTQQHESLKSSESEEILFTPKIKILDVNDDEDKTSQHSSSSSTSLSLKSRELKLKQAKRPVFSIGEYKARKKKLTILT